MDINARRVQLEGRLKNHYKKIALSTSIILTLIGLITTITLSLPPGYNSTTHNNDDEISKCQLIEFLNIPMEEPNFRFCQTGINLDLKDTLAEIETQMQTSIVSKFYTNENITKIVLNHIICLLVSKPPL
jgi:hypothetical protein